MSCSRGNTCAESRLKALASSSRAARKARSSSPGIPRSETDSAPLSTRDGREAEGRAAALQPGQATAPFGPGRGQGCREQEVLARRAGLRTA